MIKHPIPYLLLAGSLLAACSESPDPIMLAAAPNAPLPPAVIPEDVAGTWYSRIEKNAVNCGAGETIDGQVFVITQDDDEITILTSAGDLYTGTVNGDIVEWDGSYSERGGTASFTSASIVVAADSGSGNAAWTWSDGVDSCNGTMAFSIQKDIAAGESDQNSDPHIADPFDFVDNVAFFHGSLGAGRDTKDYFIFTADADATVQVELSHFDTAAADLDLRMFDLDLNELAVSDSTDSFEMFSVPVAAGMTYYIKVEAASISSEQLYNLTVDIN